MKRLAKFIVKVFMVNYMGSRLIHTGQKPSAEERLKYL